MNKLNLFLAIALLLSFNSYSQEKESIELKDYYGDLNARFIGPAVMSGRISDMENHPTDPKVIYAGTAGGGVWKSENAGTTFRPIFDDHSQSIGAVELDPNDPDNTIYVGTGEPWPRNSVSIGDGLYKSTDGGQSWLNIGLKNSERISDIIVNPDNSNEIYVGVLGALWSDSEERGVYKSTDGGQSWENILYINQSTGQRILPWIQIIQIFYMRLCGNLEEDLGFLNQEEKTVLFLNRLMGERHGIKFIMVFPKGD